MKMISIPFRYKQREYFSLVRVKCRCDEVKLEVTIMNGDLERILYGYHIFVYNARCVETKSCSDNPVINQLQHAVKSAIDQYAERNPLQMAS
jgi:hypothetical protein